MSRATIYSKEHRVVSKHPVTLTMPTGTVQGASHDHEHRHARGDLRRRRRRAPRADRAARRAARRSAATRASRSTSPPSSSTSTTRTKTALFMGNVVAVQGDSTLKAPELHIELRGQGRPQQLTGAAPTQPARTARSAVAPRRPGAAWSSPSAPTGASPASRPTSTPRPIRRCSRGNVLVNQRKNVLQGRRLFVDRKAGKSRLDAGRGRPAGRPHRRDVLPERSQDGAPPKPKPRAATAAAAQDGMLGSFKTDPNAPMDIEADTLDVYDTAKQAVFRGNVKAQQGDFVVRTVELTAFYTGQAGLGMARPAATRRRARRRPARSSRASRPGRRC